MIIREAIQRIQSLYSKGVASDDSRLKSRHIYSKLRTIRSKLLSEKYNKRQTLASINYQVLPCVKVIKAPLSECPCIPPLGCCIYRIENPLPSPITGMNGHIIRSVTSLDGKIRFSEITWEDKKYKQYDKYTADKPDYFISNEYLYITSKVELEVIRIELLLEDPIEGYTYPMYCEQTSTCTPVYEREFHLESTLFDAAVELTVQLLIGVFNQNQEDSTNNTKDNPEQTTK